MSNTGYKIANGTDVITYVQTTLTTGANTFSSPLNMFYGNGANLIGCVGPANMVTTDTEQTIVPIKTFTQGIYTATSCIQGRNDAFGYTTIPPGFTTQPIGYNLSLTTTSAAILSGTFTSIPLLPAMNAGVWIVSGTITITKTTGTWNTAAYIGLGYSTSASDGDRRGCKNARHWFGSIAGISGINSLIFQYPTLHFIALTSTSQVTPTIFMSYSGATGTYVLNFQAVKVA